MQTRNAIETHTCPIIRQTSRPPHNSPIKHESFEQDDLSFKHRREKKHHNDNKQCLQRIMSHYIMRRRRTRGCISCTGWGPEVRCVQTQGGNRLPQEAGLRPRGGPPFEDGGHLHRTRWFPRTRASTPPCWRAIQGWWFGSNYVFFFNFNVCYAVLYKVKLNRYF